MGISIEKLLAQLPSYDVTFLRNSVVAAQRVENEYNKKFEHMIFSWNDFFVQYITDEIQNERPSNFEFADLRSIEYLLLRHKFDSMKAGIIFAENKAPEQIRLARSIKIPKSFKDLMVWWDQVRKNRAPLYIQKQAKQIKRKYIQKCQSVWQKYSDLFRTGETFNQKQIALDVRHAGDTVHSRAKIIVNTETTRYYNQARVKIYNASDVVTHYLYVAIRDYRTTAWCNDRNGLIYDKTTKLCKKETPPIHYQCRSEMLPLTPHNKSHRKLIENEKLKRENNKCKPLLEGWNE